ISLKDDSPPCRTACRCLPLLDAQRSGGPAAGRLRLRSWGVARPAARQMSFADLELLRQGMRLEPLLQAVCDFLYRQPALIERVRRDRMPGLKQPEKGRRGLTAPQVLRALDLLVTRTASCNIATWELFAQFVPEEQTHVRQCHDGTAR